jgi:hypothetical protein
MADNQENSMSQYKPCWDFAIVVMHEQRQIMQQK